MTLSPGLRALVNNTMLSARPADLDAALKLNLNIFNALREQRTQPPAQLRMFIFKEGSVRAVLTDDPVFEPIESSYMDSLSDRAAFAAWINRTRAKVSGAVSRQLDKRSTGHEATESSSDEKH